MSTLSGELTVRRGTLSLKGTTQFANVTNLVVSGGTLALDTDSPSFGTSEAVAARKLTMTLGSSAELSIADGLTVNVDRLRIGEAGQKAGDYTGEGGPSTATVLPQLSGTGVLHVGRSSGLGTVLILR